MGNPLNHSSLSEQSGTANNPKDSSLSESFNAYRIPNPRLILTEQFAAVAYPTNPIKEVLVSCEPRAATQLARPRYD